MNHASTRTLSPSLPVAVSATAATDTAYLQIMPGQAIWLYLEGGSTLYCEAGQTGINSPWTATVALRAEDAPYCNGAHAGWHQLEALGPHAAQLQITRLRRGLVHSAWHALGQWIGIHP